MAHTPESSEPSLCDLLTLVVEKAGGMLFSSQPVGLVEALKSPDLNVWHQASETIEELSKGLVDAVVRDESFLGNAVRQVNLASGSIGFYPQFVGTHLVIQAVKTRSADAAIAWLRKVLETNEAAAKTIQTLWGVPVTEAFDLTPDVRIVPIRDLADTEQRRYMMGSNFRTNALPISSMLEYMPFESALVVNHTISPLLRDPALGDSPVTNFVATTDLLKDISLALTVVGPRMAITGFQWFEYDDPDFSLSRGYSNYILEVLPLHIYQCPVLDADEARKIITAYLELKGRTRQVVRVALQRISQAFRRHNAGDAAVELSTAFEALLGDSSTTEMTHKIKVRAVRLIGGSVEVRRSNAAIINKAYGIRSKLVHTGQVNEADIETVNGKRMTGREIIDQALILCVDLVKKIILRGTIPDWAVFDISEQT
ncbi:hypothetical protein LQR30_02115 [Chromobacterium piscinae]|uniref:HEPN domain-containing protein n=1 Tax=Chromobacterium piscinae TaxID=686831 RepID=UPI001E541C21|nr:HEPN domain-containing protein [Chromobacterium piscinae]MCD4502888.1 hypothetical protein [Chromobacterium piscinae]